jgi:hypothetical protein
MTYLSLRLKAEVFILFLLSAFVFGQTQASPSSSSRHSKASLPHPKSNLEAGSVVSGVYRNRSLGLSCKIPEGWVLRTEEMNQSDDETAPSNSGPRVLLAAFSRPPDARGEDG